MALIAKSVVPGLNNDRLIFVRTECNNVFVKKRVNTAKEDSIAMCEKLVGAKLRTHLWQWVKKVDPVVEMDALHSEAISMDLERTAERYEAVAQDDMPF